LTRILRALSIASWSWSAVSPVSESVRRKLADLVGTFEFVPTSPQQSGTLQLYIPRALPDINAASSSSSMTAETDECYWCFEDEPNRVSVVETPPPPPPQSAQEQKIGSPSPNFLSSFGTTPSPKTDTQGLELLGWSTLDDVMPLLEWNPLLVVD
jgi:hypothetical protein